MPTRTHPVALAAGVFAFLAIAMLGLPLLVQLTPAPVALAVASLAGAALFAVYVRMGRKR